MQRLALPLCLLALVGEARAEPAGELVDEKQKLGYSVGYQVGSDFRRQQIPVDAESLVRGVRDSLSGAEPALTPEEMRRILQEVGQRAAAAAQKQAEERARANLEEGKAFLAENGRRAGVETRPSGLQYEVLEPGTGPRPQAGARVTVHYRGTLLDGTEFDSSYARGEPASFPLERVIAGWQEALLLMAQGARWKLFVPPDLAYGERGAGPSIPGNAALIFEVELLSANAE